jgi:hypothetical protein
VLIHRLVLGDDLVAEVGVAFDEPPHCVVQVLRRQARHVEQVLAQVVQRMVKTGQDVAFVHFRIVGHGHHPTLRGTRKRMLDGDDSVT